MREKLLEEMEKHSVTVGAVAERLGIHRNSVRNKLYGMTGFLLSEAVEIHRTFFSDCCFWELFGLNPFPECDLCKRSVRRAEKEKGDASRKAAL